MGELPDIWTQSDVDILNAEQARYDRHPYTCPGNYPSCENQRELIATTKGWVCQCGKYRQFFAFKL